MKTLQQHIFEKLLINKSYKSDEQYFIYKLDKKEQIKIFDHGWPQFDEYRDKVYVDGEHVKLDNYGLTVDKYEPEEYYIEIRDIDKIKKCNGMFWNCWHLVSVPLFNTNKIMSMKNMFRNCNTLISVTLLDTSNVIDMYRMFFNCNNLNDETKQEWSNVYDFNTNKMK